MATTRFETAAQIVKDAALVLGLPEAADPFASSDVAQSRLCRLLTAAGRELVQVYEWPHLRKVCDITAALGDGRAWSVPADFAGIIQHTAWNQTARQRFVGPLDAEEWARYEANNSVAPVSPAFRLIQGVFAVVPTSSVSDGDLLQYEYQGKSWTSATGGTVPTDDRTSTGTDIVYFDPMLMHWALRRAWKVSNSESTAVEEAAYWQAIERAKGMETAPGTLSIVPRRTDPLAPRAPDGVWTI